MNEILNDNLGLQRYAADIARAEQLHKQRAALDTARSSVRDRVALGLVAMAAKLQPALAIDVQHQPASSARSALTTRQRLLTIAPGVRLGIGQEPR